MAIAKSFSKKFPLLLHIRQFFVWCMLLYLRFFAKRALLKTHAITIGIAGAVGKSTTKHALKHILPDNALILDGNSETGIPLGILGMNHGTYSVSDWIRILVRAPWQTGNLLNTPYIVAEMGIDGPHPPKNMEYLLTIFAPNIAIVLSESPAHVANYEPIVPESVTTSEEKLSWILNYMLEDDGTILLQNNLRFACIDASDADIFSFATKHVPKGKLATVGFSKQHDITIQSHYVAVDSTTFEFLINDHNTSHALTLTLQNMALPKETGMSIGCAIQVATYLQIPRDVISNRLRSFTLPTSRGTLFRGINNTTIIDSSYNSSPASVHAFLLLLKDLSTRTKQETVVIFGEMLELGSFSTFEHQRIAHTLVGVAGHIFLVGNNTKEYMLPILENHQSSFQSIHSYRSVQELCKDITLLIPSNSLVLVKGAGLLEEAIKTLLVDPEDRRLLCRQDEFWKHSKIKNRVWMG